MVSVWFLVLFIIITITITIIIITLIIFTIIVNRFLGLKKRTTLPFALKREGGGKASLKISIFSNYAITYDIPRFNPFFGLHLILARTKSCIVCLKEQNSRI